MNVRRLGWLDLEPLLAVMGEHVLLSSQPYEPDVLRHYVKHSLIDDHWRYFGLFHKAALVGYLMGTKEPYYYNRLHYFNCHYLYVKESTRSLLGGRSLVRAMEEEAKALGCAESFLAVNHGIGHEKSLRYFTAIGYSHVGGVVRKTLT